MKPLPALVIFVAGLLAGIALAWLALRPSRAPEAQAPAASAPTSAPAASAPSSATESAPTPGDVEVERVDHASGEVKRREISDHDGWRKQGFVEMTPPVRLPSDGAENDKIEVWLHVPDGARIEAVRRDGRATLRFPPGTIADRIESFAHAKGAWSVIDVRGTRIEDGGESFHVFVPASAEPLGRLVGWEWARGDERAQREATSLLVSHLEATRTIQDAGRTPAERGRIVEDYRRNNDCASCHARDKPEQTARVRGIHRGTDASGFYVPLSVLMDTVPLERHRARDLNAGDPFLTFSCPSGAPVLVEGEGGAREHRCPQGGSPSATLDVRKALAAKDARTIAMCRSRAYLREHMDDAARAVFAEAFVACGL